jgi:hypothetical protein
MSSHTIQQHEHSADGKQAACTPRLVFYAGKKVDESHVVNPESFLMSGFHELLTGAPGDQDGAPAFALSIAAFSTSWAKVLPRLMKNTDGF